METRSITAEVPMGPRMSEDPTKLVPEVGEVSAALFKVVGNGSVPRSTISLVQLRAGQIVGSTYLTGLHTGFLHKAGEPQERIASVAS
jgi:alkylhydroperoxidase family enzyme